MGKTTYSAAILLLRHTTNANFLVGLMMILASMQWFISLMQKLRNYLF